MVVDLEPNGRGVLFFLPACCGLSLGSWEHVDWVPEGGGREGKE